MGKRCQSFVGVVLAQQDAVFGPRSEHAVRFFRALGDQIVDQHTDVGLASAERDGLEVPRGTCRVDARHNPLASGFLVACGSVDLACEVQALNQTCFKAVLELGGGEVVVLHGVTGTKHLGLFKPRNLSHGRQLDVFGKRGAEPVDVDLAGVPPLRLHEHLVSVFVRKAVNLVFDAGTVAGAKSSDASIEHRRAVEAFAEQLVNLGGGVRDVT